MRVLENFQIDANFWQMNPQLRIPEEFASLYSDDKTKDKNESSKIMWAIALLIHPDSKFFQLKFNEKKDLISKDYLKDKSFKWSKYKPQMLLFEKLCLTSGERQLFIWDKMMDEKTEFMSTLNYRENGDLIEKLLTTNSNLFKEFDRIKKQLSDESLDGRVKGGIEESANEKGLI